MANESEDRLKYAQDYALAALRGLFVGNGGAIIALGEAQADGEA